MDDSLNDNLSEETVVNLGGCWKQMILMDGEYLYPSEIVAEDAIQLALATVNIAINLEIMDLIIFAYHFVMVIMIRLLVLENLNMLCLLSS